MDHSKPWAYFDGASQQNNLFCGGGATLYLNKKTCLQNENRFGDNIEQVCIAHVPKAPIKLCRGKRNQVHSNFWRFLECHQLGYAITKMSQSTTTLNS